MKEYVVWRSKIHHLLFFTWRCCVRHINTCLILLALITVFDGGVLATPLFFNNWDTMLDYGLHHETLCVVVGVITVFVYSVGTVLIAGTWSILRNQIETTLMMQAHKTVQKKSLYAALPGFSSGERLRRDFAIVAKSIEAFFNGHVRFVIRILIVTYFSFTNVPFFSVWVFLFFCLSSIGLFRQLVKTVSSEYQQVETEYRSLWTVALNLLQTMPLVRESRREKAEEQSLSELVHAYNTAYFRKDLKVTAIHVWYHLLFFVGILVGWFYSEYYSPKSFLELDHIWIFLLLWLWVGSYLHVVTQASAVIIHNGPILERVMEAITYTADDDVSDGVPYTNTANIAVALNAICVDVPKVAVLEDISCTIPARSIVAFVSTGDEASLLVKTIARQVSSNTGDLISLKSGEVLLNEKPISDWDQNQLDHLITYVGSVPLMMHRSVLANLVYSAEHQPVPASTVADLLDTLNLSDLIIRLPKGLNTILDSETLDMLTDAEKQLLAVGRSLLTPASVLILNQALDKVSFDLKSKVIDYLCRTPRRKTVIITSSTLESLRNVDTIHVIDKGHLVGSDSHYELLKNNRHYHQMYFAQARLSLVSQNPKPRSSS